MRFISPDLTVGADRWATPVLSITTTQNEAAITAHDPADHLLNSTLSGNSCCFRLYLCLYIRPYLRHMCHCCLSHWCLLLYSLPTSMTSKYLLVPCHTGRGVQRHKALSGGWWLWNRWMLSPWQSCGRVCTKEGARLFLWLWLSAKPPMHQQYLWLGQDSACSCLHSNSCMLQHRFYWNYICNQFTIRTQKGMKSFDVLYHWSSLSDIAE